MTAAQPGERVRFVVYGDTRTHGDTHRRVVDAIRDEGPDFLFSTGDLVDTSNEEEWRIFFNIEYALLLNTPLYPALGNHDKMGGDARFKELFPVTGGNNFYASDFGDVHVASLDSNGSLAAQAAWLDNDLQQARERGAKHLFIIMHHGAYSGASGFGSHGSNAEARSLIVPIAAKHGVAAMFAGHDHIYERGQSPQGVAYFVTGGGGAPFHGAGRLPETIMSAVKNHYLVVDVAGPNVSITAKDLAGNAFDTVSLTR
jgi:3',5'-cyclic AMP phosphodiesterase CpdA